jgi:hypothetical protein
LNIIQDIAYVNGEVLKKTTENVKENPQVLFLGFAYVIVGIGVSFLMNYLLSGPIGIFGGIIMAILQSALVSSYLFVLGNVIVYNRFRWEDARYGLTHYLWKVYGIFFIFYISNMVLNLLAGIIGTIIYTIYWVLPLIILLLLNPLPEAIYIKDRDPLDTIIYTFGFMKENWLNWLIPNIAFMFLIYVFTSGIFSSEILGSGSGGIVWFIMLIASGVVISVGMLYRGHLFALLNGSTRRKRQFMRKF